MVILDACAIIAYLRDEEGAELVETVLLNERCYAHAVNMCEVYKDCLSRKEGTTKADELVEDLISTGLVTREDMDKEFWRLAAELKADIRKISYADCFALALTSRMKGVLYSSDHHELDPIAKQGKYPITFIR